MSKQDMGSGQIPALCLNQTADGKINGHLFWPLGESDLTGMNQGLTTPFNRFDIQENKFEYDGKAERKQDEWQG